MSCRKSTVVATMGVCALAAVGAAVLFVPAETWSKWFYGDRFSFCGHDFEGSAIVFVVDRSGSNNHGFSLAKPKIVDLIERSAPHFELGVVFSDRGVYRFPASGAVLRATRQHKNELKAAVSGMPGGGGSCPHRGLLVALEMAKDSRAERKLVVYMGDGGGTCQGGSEAEYLRQTLAEIQAKNGGEVVIHCVNSKPGSRVHSDFLYELSDATGGTVVPLSGE